MKVEGNDSQKNARSLRRMAWFVIVMLPLVIGLGVWQLQRAGYKQQLMEAYFDKLGGLPVTLVGAELPDAFTRIRVRGQYLSTNLLLDNKVDNARQGYWVYTPFTSSSTTWLVNRGWIAAPPKRDQQPVIPAPPSGEVDLVAVVWPDTGMLPLFGKPPIARLDESTLRLQRLDFQALKENAEKEPAQDEWLANFVAAELRLEPAQPGTLKAVPQLMGFGVERHQGYAFQWFGLAIALVTGYFFYRRSFSRAA